MPAKPLPLLLLGRSTLPTTLAPPLALSCGIIELVCAGGGGTNEAMVGGIPCNVPVWLLLVLEEEEEEEEEP